MTTKFGRWLRTKLCKHIYILCYTDNTGQRKMASKYIDKHRLSLHEYCAKCGSTKSYIKENL
jgi:hypothetical protein